MKPNATALRNFALAAAVFITLSWLRIDADRDSTLVAGPAGNSRSSTAGEIVDGTDPVAITDGGDIVDGGAGTDVGGTTAAGGGPATTLPAGAKPAKAGLACERGRNGGATDTGVSATKIRLATTAVLDGPAKTLLEDSPVAMKAVVDKVNKAGGVCGRLLELKVVNDSFRADDGLQKIRNFIAEGYFALPVVPSAEGLGSAIESGEISKAKIPVVGTDGMRKEQYADPFVWPVASATVTAMRVMAKYGYTNRNARSFAIVYDSKYRFGIEGKDAFVKQVEALGGTVRSVIPLDPDRPNYSTEVHKFNGECKDTGADVCDMVALLLLPDAATKWLKAQPNRANLYAAGAQTLFSDRFAQDCVINYGAKCDGFAVWTGYNPPIGTLKTLPGVSTYVNDVTSVKSGIDVTNQFVEGAYLGMSVFVEALKRVGPDLTRERLRQVMDSMTYQTDLSSTLTWAPGKHSANVRSQSFEMTVSGGAFRGWRAEGNGFLLDPAFGG